MAANAANNNANNPPPIYVGAGPFDVELGMKACGVDDAKCKDLADSLFGNQFTKHITDDDIKDGFKALSELPTQTRVRLDPMVKRKVRGFNQWMKHMYRLGRDPKFIPFDKEVVEDMMIKAHIMKKFTSETGATKSVAESETFTKDMVWDDWHPTVTNYFRMIPGIEGIPLSYVLRESDQPDPRPNPDFQDDYIMNAPLHGSAYMADARTVHAAIRRLIQGNTEAEAIIKPHEPAGDGRLDWKALKLSYKGKGIYGTELQKATDIIRNSFYIGEKKQMYWTKFQTELDWAFAVYTKRHGNGQPYHLNEIKVKTLLDKVRATFLESTKSAIKIQMLTNPNFQYSQACLLFKAEVTAPYPRGPNGDEHTPRYIKQTSNDTKRSNGNGNISRLVQQFNDTHRDAEMVRLKNGSKIKYHASYNYPPAIYKELTNETKKRMKEERQAYKNKRRKTNDGNGNDRVVKELERVRDEMREDLITVVSEIVKKKDDKDSPNESQISDLTSIFGGRKDQQFCKKRSKG